MNVRAFAIVAALMLVGCGSFAERLKAAPAAPPMKCEIQQRAWCIYQGAYEISDRAARDSVHDRIWTMWDSFRPESKLVVLEMYGCRTSFSDTLQFLSFEQDVTWESQKWDRVRFRLKKDQSCDVDVLMPPYDGDQMEWAFSTGLMLVKQCTDEKCSGEPLADLKPKFEAEFKKGLGAH